MQRIFSIVLAAVSCLSLFHAAYSIRAHAGYKARIEAEARGRAVSATKTAAGQIDAILSQVQQAAEKAAEDLTTGRLAKDRLNERLKAEFRTCPNLFGALIAYKPYGFSPGRRLFAPYAMSQDGVVRIVQVEDQYDYTAPGKSTMYYALPIGSGASQWVEPFWGNASNRLVYAYAAVFYRDAKHRTREDVQGIVLLTVDLKEIKSIIESLDLGSGGYGAMISRKGTYLYHPVAEYVRGQKSIFEVAREKNDPDRRTLGVEAERGGSGVIEHLSTTTGLAAWLIYEPIPSSGAALNNTFLKDDIPFDVDELRQQVIRIIVSLALFVIASLLLALRVFDGDPRRLAWASLAVSAALIAGVAAIWLVTLELSPNRRKHGIRIIDQGSLHRFISDYRGRAKEAVFVPTGVLVTSADFLSESRVSVCGYVWQRYSAGVHERLARGVEFPDAEALEINEAYRFKEGGVEVVGWKFKAMLTQKFDYAKFPLDQEQIKVGLRHKDFIKHVALIPDLGSYQLINPSTLPGISGTMVLPGWEIQKSYFEYFPRVFNANLGIPAGFFRDNSYEMYFKIVTRRLILNVIVSKVLPIAVVSILLFIFLMSVTSDPARFEAMRTGVVPIMSAASGLFFVTIYSHIDLRSKLGGDAVCYLEYIYFIIYLLFLSVSATALLFASRPDLRLVRYQDCLIPKLLYWPALTVVLFLVTVKFFY